MWHSRGMARRFLWVLAAPLVAAGMAAGFGPAAASAVACQNWTGVQLPSPGSVVNEVDGVTVVSPSDVWAAGFGFGNGPDQTLIEHWDGSSWTVLPSPNPGSGDNQLRGIRALSANNIWAVGSYSTGTTWAQVPSPSPGASSNTLWGVAATCQQHLGDRGCRQQQPGSGARAPLHMTRYLTGRRLVVPRRCRL